MKLTTAITEMMSKDMEKQMHLLIDKMKENLVIRCLDGVVVREDGCEMIFKAGVSVEIDT